MERMESAKEQSQRYNARGVGIMPSSEIDRGALSIGQLAKRWRLSPVRVRGLVESGLLPGAFTVPSSGAYGEATRIPLSTVIEAEEKWTVTYRDDRGDGPPRRKGRGSRPGLEHFPELSLEHDIGCREGG